MKKGTIYEGIIERVDFPNKGIVHIPEENQYVIVKNGIPGQKVRFMINKFKKGSAEGRLLEVLEKSPLETRTPVCSIFPECGGCMYQTMPYEEQIRMKEGQIRRIMDEAVQGEYVFEGVKSSQRSSDIGIRWNSLSETSIKTGHSHWDFIRKEAPMTSLPRRTAGCP